MNKKLFKKALTAVLTAALLFTSSGFASLNASAAEKIYVEGVYTNFQKATMSTGTSRQINAYVEPSNATVQVLQYKSSAPEVASVSSTGLISALSPGKATITVTALDGSSQTEKIKITVLEDLFITGDMVDSDNDVVVLDKTYGNLYIDGSVGDADIYLSGVTVRNILAMGSGDYSLYTYESSIKELILDDVAGEIESFAITDEDNKAAPNLIVGENTQISNLNARISASIRQEDGSAIEGLRVTQDAEGKLTVYLENYSGGLLLDSSLGDMEIITTGCSLSSVNVTGNEDAGNIHLVNGGDSEISNLILSKAANVTLDVPATQVDIDRNASGAALTSNSDIGALTDAGSGSNIIVAGSIDSFEANGSGSNINIASGGYVGMINLNGEGSKLSGAGTVSEAYVNANNVSVDTVNTLIVVGNVSGTKVQGNNVAGGSTTTTKPPVGGGGGGPLPPLPEKEINVGDVIVDNDFEDGRNGLTFKHGSSDISAIVVQGGNNSDKALRVSGRTQNYFGVGYNFAAYLQKHITVKIKFDIMVDTAKTAADDAIKATMKTNKGYPMVAGSLERADSGDIYHDYAANTWYTFENTFDLTNDITAAELYFEAPAGVVYYLDNVLITVDSIGNPIPVATVTLDNTNLVLNRNETRKLTATILPDSAEVRTVTWSSSDTNVATVDSDGVVTGKNAGTATIKATSNCSYAEPKPFAECEVEVLDVVVIALDRNYIFFTEAGQTKTLSAGATATWTSSNEAVATVSNAGVVTAVGNGTATITAEIEGGIGSCTVKVDLQPDGSIVFDFDDEATGTVKGMKGSGSATIVNDITVLNSTNKVLKVEHVTYGYSQAAYLTVTLPAGKKLGDYTSLKAKVHLASGDVTNKNLRVWAGGTIDAISVGYSATASQIGASANKSGNKVFEPVIAEFTTMSSTLRDLSGTITIALGFMTEPNTVFYLDEIILVPFTGDPVPITGITLNKDTLALAEGRTETLTATINPANYTTSGEITWTSSNPAVATVDANGKVTAVSQGTTTITATTAIDGVSLTTYDAACDVIVTEATTDDVIFETGFEDGDSAIAADGGNPTIVNTISYEGTKSLRITATASWNGPQYVLTNNSDEAVTYQVSSYVRKEEDGEASIRYVRDGSYDGGSYTTYNTVELTNEWQLFTAEIPVGAGEELRFRLSPIDAISGTYIYYVDNFKITKPADVPSDVLLFETDFDNGNNPITAAVWDSISHGAVHNGGVVGVVTGPAIGLYSLEIDAGSADYKGIGYRFESAGTYRITAKVRNAVAATGTSIRLQDQTKGEFVTGSNLVIDNGDWSLLDVTFTLTGGADIILSPHYSNPAYHFYVDDFKVYKVSD